MENVSSFKYEPSLTRTYTNNRRALAYLDVIPSERLQKHFESLVKRVQAEDESSDIHLQAFLSVFMPLEFFIENPPCDLTLVVFPKYGQISQYVLREDEEFYSNIHQNPDPLIIKGIKRALYIKPSVRREDIWFPGKDDYIPNTIRGMVLMKRNPLKPQTNYPGFEEYLGFEPGDNRTHRPINPEGTEL